MQNLTHELNGILSEELGLYVGLLEYGKRKKAALIGNDVDEIGRLTRLESESLDRLNVLLCIERHCLPLLRMKTATAARSILTILQRSCRRMIAAHWRRFGINIRK